MRAHWFGISSSVIALAVGLSGARAQDTVGAPAPGVNATPATQVEVGPVQTRATISPAEQLQQSAEIQRRSDQLAQRLTKMLDESRRDRDILRANCVNRKLTEVNATARNIGQRVQGLKDANSVNDDARRSHEFTVLTVLAEKLNSLDTEATQCLGQSVYEPGASQIVTTIQQGSPTFTTTIVDPSSQAPASIGVPPPNLVPSSSSGMM